MNWYWTVRIYRPDGNYSHVVVKTGRDLREIDTIEDFYRHLTGCKMLLEGMSEIPPSHLSSPSETFLSFLSLWNWKTPS